MSYLFDMYGIRNKDFFDGFMAAVDTYAIWSGGVRVIGCLNKTIQEVEAEARRDLLGEEPTDNLIARCKKVEADLKEALFQKQGYYDQVSDLQAELAEANKENERLRRALEPFANVARQHEESGQSTTSNTVFSLPSIHFYIAKQELERGGGKRARDALEGEETSSI